MEKSDFKEIISKIQEPVYIFDSIKFKENFKGLLNSFRKIYPNYNIAYSYKTNYTPEVCSLVKELGGYAEVVSDMEYFLAKKLGYKEEKIIYNGPCKGENLDNFILNGGICIVDNQIELNRILNLALINNKDLEIGLRVNAGETIGKKSRFGFYFESEEFKNIFELLRVNKRVKVVGLHCHITGARDLVSWKKRIELLLKLADEYIGIPKFLDLGSGMYGKMVEELAVQFNSEIPTFSDYAEVVASRMNKHYINVPLEEKPLLITEPGTTLVADSFYFISKVIAIKCIKDQNYAILNCSYHNIGELSSKKNLPITILGKGKSEYKNVNFVGYTCLEYDLLYRNYNGFLDIGDYVIFANIGSYSNTLKPPFIWPNCAMIAYDSEEKEIKLIKRKETFDDIFKTYII